MRVAKRYRDRRGQQGPTGPTFRAHHPKGKIMKRHGLRERLRRLRQAAGK